MNQGQSVVRWIVNIVLFILLVLLILTGLINWVLPGGGNHAAEGVGSFVHHFMGEVHEVSAVLFMVAISVHIWLHWAYITSHLKRLRKTS